MIKAVCFDLDDTLYDYRGFMAQLEEYLCARISEILRKPLPSSRRAYAATKKRLYRERPSDPAIFDFRERISFFLSAMGRAADRGLQEELYRDFWERFLSIIQPYPDTIPALLGLRKAGKKTAIVSNGTRDQQTAKLRSLGLFELFDALVFSEDVGSNKPNPPIFRRALTALKTRPGEAMMVGDICGIDIKGAKEVGMLTCWMRRGAYANRSPRNHTEEPDFAISRLTQLEKVLDAFQGFH